MHCPHCGQRIDLPQETFHMPSYRSVTIVRCPICEGRGIVPQGFYRHPSGIPFSSSDASHEECKACNGSGILER
jgi:hypothetical protein